MGTLGLIGRAMLWTQTPIIQRPEGKLSWPCREGRNRHRLH